VKRPVEELNALNHSCAWLEAVAGRRNSAMALLPETFQVAAV
jgi:hypothetical protein